MIVSVDRSEVKGTVFVPSSKSYTHRAIAIAALSSSTVRIRRPLLSADTESTIRAAVALGASIERTSAAAGNELIVTGGYPATPDDVINVANSGTTLRIMSAVSSLCDGTTVLTGDGSIRKRPNGPLLEALGKLGGHAFSTRDNGCAPLVISGRLTGGEVTISGSISSQFISALLIACPLASEDTVITVDGILKSRPYVDITLSMLEEAGISITVEEDPHLPNTDIRFRIRGNQTMNMRDYTVPGDFSSSSYLLGAAAVTGSHLVVHNLFPSRQGDAAIIDILRNMGADINWDQEKGTVEIHGGNLHGTVVDVSRTPDLVPTIAVLAAVAQGTTIIGNAEHVRYKETDRLHAMAVELTKMGVDIKEEQDKLIITGGNLHGADVHGWDDHRIVMALTVAGMVTGGVTIDTAESVAISFPDFFDTMKGIGAGITCMQDSEIGA